MQKKGRALLLAGVMGLAFGSGALAQTETVTYQGRLTDAGGPANGSFDLTFRIFDAATGGNLLWNESLTGVSVTAGLFTVVLGQTTPLQVIFAASPRWLEIEVLGSTLSPRQELTSAPGALYSSRAGLATDFSGNLAGEVTGAQTTTVVSNAVSGNTPNAIVRRDASGDFAAGTITAALNGNATSATNFSGNLLGEVTGNQTNTLVSNAVPTNTLGAIVRRDPSGDFAAGTITAALNGNATTATSATSATSFTGPLVGEVTGNQTTTFVLNAVSANTTGAIVRRDGSGNFAAGTITASLAGNASTATALAANAANCAGGVAAGVSATGAAEGCIPVASTNTPNAIVQRDGSGDFAARTVTLAGNLDIPDTSSATVGVVTKNGTPFLHNAGFSSTFLGASAGNMSVTGFGNVGVGVSALGSIALGARNVALGQSALLSNQDGASNVAVGDSALFTSVTGGSNVAVGRNALNALEILGAPGGDLNIAIGAGAGSNLLSGNNNIYIGNLGGVVPESNTIRIGAAHTATFVAGISGKTVAGGVAVLVDTNGHLGTVVSSRRYKEDITDLGAESDVLMRLRPVSFYYKRELDATHARQYGLVAEEVAEAAPQLVVYDTDGAPQAVRYNLVDALLLGEVQKQRRLLEEQRTTIERQDTQIQDLMERLTRLESSATTVR